MNVPGHKSPGENKAVKNPEHPASEHNFAEAFEVELDCWCYGLRQVKENLHPAVVHRVVKELTSVVQESIRQEFCFNLCDAAKRLAESAKGTVSEKEIAFHLLSQLPEPHRLSSDSRRVLLEVIGQGERVYGGAVERVEKKWGIKLESLAILSPIEGTLPRIAK